MVVMSSWWRQKLPYVFGAVALTIFFFLQELPAGLVLTERLLGLLVLGMIALLWGKVLE